MSLKIFLVYVSIFLMCLTAIKIYKVELEIQEKLESINDYSDELKVLKFEVAETNLYVQFLEQLIPDVQKRNSKAKAIKEIIETSINNTKQKFFRTEREYNDYVLSVVDYSELYKVPVSLVLAVSRAESNFNPKAISVTNAQGIMQLMPDTTRFCVKTLNKSHHDPFYVRDSVQCGTWYLRQMIDIFNDEDSVIRAYNVGPSYLLKFSEKELPIETVNYHQKVSDLILEYRKKLKWEN